MQVGYYVNFLFKILQFVLRGRIFSLFIAKYNLHFLIHFFIFVLSEFLSVFRVSQQKCAQASQLSNSQFPRTIIGRKFVCDM